MIVKIFIFNNVFSFLRKKVADRNTVKHNKHSLIEFNEINI